MTFPSREVELNFAPVGLRGVAAWPSAAEDLFLIDTPSSAGQEWTVSGLRARRDAGTAALAYRLSLQATYDGTTWTADLAGQEVNSADSPLGAWVTIPAFTATIPSDAVAVRLRLWRNGGIAISTDGADLRATGPALVPIRLEVGLEPSGLTNLIQNGSGEQGGYGWVTPVPGSVLVGEVSSATSYQQGLRYTAAADAGGNYFYTEPLPVAAGEWARAQWHVNYTPYNAYRVRIDWLNSTGALLSSTAWTTFTASFADHSISAAQAPASTVYARLRFEVGGGGIAGTYPYVYGGSNFSIRDAVMAKAATSGGLADLSATVAIDWADVLGPTHEIQVSREDLNLGTLTATILDATLDPAVGNTIRPGRPVRLSAWNDDSATFETLFRGLATAAEVRYDTRRLLVDAGDSRHAKITLEAADATRALAAANRPDGVATISDLPYVLEGCGVPWVVNANSNQVASADVVAVNESASALDQVAITRDSDLGYAWVDRNGILQAWSALADPNVELIANGTFELSLIGWWAQSDGSAPSFTRSSTFAHAGTYSARLAAAASGTTTVMHIITRNAADMATWGAIPVTPGVTYRLTAKVRADFTARTCFAGMTWYDEPGVAANIITEAGGAGETVSTITDSVGSWTDLDVEFTAPPGATAADLRLGVAVASGAIAPGEAHFFDSITLRALVDVPVLDESVYSDVEVSFDTDNCINEVTVKYLLLEAGGTAEVQYGPYVDAASVAEWGRHSSEFTVQGIPQDPASIQAYANLILAANATPGVRVRSMRVPINAEADLTGAKAFLDLYDLTNVVYGAKGINEHSRVIGLVHTITPTGWLLDVSFTAQGSVAAPLVTASPAGRIDPLGSGPASVPVGGVQPYAGANAPFGWLLCNGQAVSRTTYAALFAVIGTTFGAGNGSTTFNVPDLKNRAPVGVGSERSLGANDNLAEASRTPAHTHNASGLTTGDTSLNQSSNTSTGGTANRLTSPVNHSHNVTGNTGSSGGWTGGNSGLPHLTLNFIIKA